MQSLSPAVLRCVFTWYISLSVVALTLTLSQVPGGTVVFHIGSAHYVHFIVGLVSTINEVNVKPALIDVI